MANKEFPEYHQFAKPAELHKAINMLRGITAGISNDGVLTEDEVQELVHWCSLHEDLRNRHPFSEILPMIDAALADGVLDEEERKDIVWLCGNFVAGGDYYDITASSIQFLHGLIHGIMADGDLTDSEIKGLHNWMEHNKFLSKTYPFDDIYSIVSAILSDGVITQNEREMLSAYLSNFIEFKDSRNLVQSDFNELQEKYGVAGLYNLSPEIFFNGKVFCFTGEAYRGTREELATKVERLGGVFRNNVSSKTDYLVVGDAGNVCWAFAAYGRKMETALNLRRDGGKIQIVKESDFWDVVDAMAEEDTYA